MPDSRYNDLMKPVIIFRHAANEGPGTIESFLLQKKIPYSIVKIDQGDGENKIKAVNINDCSGLIFMGGPMSVNDDLPWIPESLSLIRQALELNMPVMGVCLGGQLMAKALGATITRNLNPEFGWLPVSAAQEKHKWMNDIPAKFDAFHWHGETFSLPDGATRIMSSDACNNQGFIIGNSIAMQCHIEMNEELVRDWAKNNDDLPEPSATVQTRDAMLINLQNKIESLQAVADSILNHWSENLK